MTRASDRIRRLVGNLAASARLDRAGVEVPTSPVTVGDLVSSAVSEFQVRASRLVLPNDAELLGTRVWADLDLAVRALVTVVENALALSPADSEVEIDLAPGGTQVVVSVLDRGPGLSEAMRNRVFGAFTQADASTSREHQGMGIGLYLAHRIMTAHGGSIQYSPREGGGSTFALTFPAYAGRPS